MRHVIWSFALVAGFATTGCSAAKSAMGILSPKTPPVTVVNNVEVAAAPQPTVVVVHDKARGKSLMEKVGIVTTATVAGAALGALAGNALDADVAAGALLGAGAGAAAGVAIAKD